MNTDMEAGQARLGEGDARCRRRLNDGLTQGRYGALGDPLTARPMRRRLALTGVTLAALLGIGVKLGPVSVLDEIGLGLFFLRCLSARQLSLRLDDLYNLCLIYFAFTYLVGFLLSGNINALRYVAIGVLILLSMNLRVMGNPSVRALENASWAFIALTITIPVVGIALGLSEAWWQDWLWSGTAYAAYGTLLSASILTWYGGLARFFLVLLLVVTAAALNDSRTTLLLCGLLVLPLLRIFAHRRGVMGKTLLATGAVAGTLLLLLAPQLLTQDISTSVGRQFEVTAETVEDLRTEGAERDLDRYFSNKAALDLKDENLVHFWFGAGGLSHQLDMLGRPGLSYSGDVVRPTGIPAIVFDGGVLLLGLMVFSAVLASWRVLWRGTDRIGGLFLSALPMVSILMLFIANMLESTLFWLVLKPGFLAGIFLPAARPEMITRR